jgi:hypothetical protein
MSKGEVNMAHVIKAAVANPDSKTAAGLNAYLERLEEALEQHARLIEKLHASALRYAGTWSGSSVTYAKGDLVTHKGQLWHATRETANKPGTSDSWQLMTRAGADKV